MEKIGIVISIKIRSDKPVVKNWSNENFKSFEKENSICALIVPANLYNLYTNKFIMITQKISIKTIIMNVSDKGRLQVIINVSTEV